MSYQVLARKWRPKTFQQLVGQVKLKKLCVFLYSNVGQAQTILMSLTSLRGKKKI